MNQAPPPIRIATIRSSACTVPIWVASWGSPAGLRRVVPGLAVDVPDQYLIDIERLAVTAWSARDRPHGRRGRTVVPADDVAVVAMRASRTVTAAAGAVWAVSALAAPMLLATATLPVDRIGARVLVGLAGGALLLTARSYRHRGARAMLRAAGLTCWAALLVGFCGVLIVTNPGADTFQIGALFALVERAGAGQLRITEMAALFWHCIDRREGLTREQVGEAVLEAGLAAAAKPLRTLLGQILQGAPLRRSSGHASTRSG